MFAASVAQLTHGGRFLRPVLLLGPCTLSLVSHCVASASSITLMKVISYIFSCSPALPVAIFFRFSFCLCEAVTNSHSECFPQIGTVALRLTICPGIAEASTVAGMAIVLFGMPLLLGYTLGFVLAAVSPAVVVNGMFALQKAGYGIKKGVPSLAVAAASFDDVVAITGYSLFIGLAIPQGALAWSLAFGPLNVIFGIVGGLTGGLALSLTYFWRTRWQRSGAIFLTSQMLMAFFVYFNFKGAGALSSLLVGAVTKNMWEAGIPKCLSTGKSTHHAHEAEADIAVAWQTFGQVRSADGSLCSCCLGRLEVCVTDVCACVAHAVLCDWRGFGLRQAPA